MTEAAARKKIRAWKRKGYEIIMVNPDGLYCAGLPGGGFARPMYPVYSLDAPEALQAVLNGRDAVEEMKKK